MDVSVLFTHFSVFIVILVDAYYYRYVAHYEKHYESNTRHVPDTVSQ